MDRPEFDEDILPLVMTEIRSKINYRLNQKDKGTYTTTHETYGIIAEEFHELMLAMHGNDPVHTTSGGEKNEILSV